MIRRSHEAIRRSRATLGRLAPVAQPTRVAPEAMTSPMTMSRLTPLDASDWPAGIHITHADTPATDMSSPTERWRLAHQLVAALREAGIECEVIDPDPRLNMH
jgi:hypothetical protein